MKFPRFPAASRLVPFALALLAGCSRPDPRHTQGYVEGEFVRVASPSGGQLLQLSVARGASVHAGDPLFALDDTAARASRDEAAHQVAQAAAALDDARQGARPTEIDALEAQLAEARAALTYAETELTRQDALRGSGANTPRDVDAARNARDTARQQVARLEANLADARLGARTAQITAAGETLRARQAALTRAEWTLAQTHPTAPADAEVADTVYRVGDWVAPGSPVVLLLPPGNVKVRTFVAQSLVGQLQPGDAATIHIDGVPDPVTAHIAWIAPRAEYAPPVIYSQDMRGKFVFLVELALAPADAARLHPGQPVDVDFPAPSARSAPAANAANTATH